MRPGFGRLFLVSVGVLAVAAAAYADDPGRYVLGRSGDSFLRLDTVTGAVSRCSFSKGEWHCEPLPAEDAASSGRLDALSAKVARLSVGLAALDARVAALVPLGPAAPRTPGFLRQAVGRLLDMVRTLKHRHADNA